MRVSSPKYLLQSEINRGIAAEATPPRIAPMQPLGGAISITYLISLKWQSLTILDA